MSLRAVRTAALAGLLAFVPGSAVWRPTQTAPSAHFPIPAPPTSLLDPRLAAERRASVSWETRTGPRREVLDLVCVVPDVPSFLAVLSAWDERTFFPVLLDEGASTYRFLAAFRPARVVRFRAPAQTGTGTADGLWRRAVDSVRNAWVEESSGRRAGLRGDAPPRALGPTPPGVVVSNPASPTLAGGVALAAGRFQPLLRWEPGRGYRDRLVLAEANRLAQDLDARIADRIPHEEVLGDACDFITLAGPYPYRYETPEGDNAFDDLLARAPLSLRRWAFTGRLIGSPGASVYAAMCSLFVRPESALLFDTYARRPGVWAQYRMQPAADILRSRVRVTERSGARGGSLAGWHVVFDPYNKFGLVMINSSGLPRDFWLYESQGLTGDVPWSVPAAVWQLHSHSAADPEDPETIAGRWLANGAFVYVGAMNEPYMQAFRTSRAVASLLAAGVPLGAAVRPSVNELFGYPWRLVYLGDPLFRLGSPGAAERRLTSDLPPGCREVLPAPPPAPSARDDARLDWALDAALLTASGRSTSDRLGALRDVLLSIRRERLAPARLERYDGLLAYLLDEPGAHEAVRQRLRGVAPGALTPVLKRRLEADRIADLHRAIARGNLAAASAAWDELVRSDAPADLKTAATGHVAALAERSGQLRLWREQLRTTLQALRTTPAAAGVEQELRRVERRLGL